MGAGVIVGGQGEVDVIPIDTIIFLFQTACRGYAHRFLLMRFGTDFEVEELDARHVRVRVQCDDRKLHCSLFFIQAKSQKHSESEMNNHEFGHELLIQSATFDKIANLV